jgi:enoyl-[acyl-carrier protein] reductase I
VRRIDLTGKSALVVGVANQRSLAWAIAEALGQAGCRLAFTYQGERLRERVAELAQGYPGSPVWPCDVTREEELAALFARLEQELGRLDILIHAVAFAPREELEGDFRATRREGWRVALEVSAYSLVDLSQRAVPLMERAGGGSILTLTYLASQRVVPRYNVMGSAKAALEHAVRQLAYELGPRNIRVNAISAGPVATLSARGIAGFSRMVEHHRQVAPLGRSIEPREVGDAALFLCSDLASAITGEILFVDAGYNIMGVARAE